jgi:hypothetical protein
VEQTGGPCPDVGHISIKRRNYHCGEKRKNLSTAFSTKIDFLPLNPYLGRLIDARPYMGVPSFWKVPVMRNFSTPQGTYPQIIATYPQIGCLKNGIL